MITETEKRHSLYFQYYEELNARFWFIASDSSSQQWGALSDPWDGDIKPWSTQVVVNLIKITPYWQTWQRQPSMTISLFDLLKVLSVVQHLTKFHQIIYMLMQWEWYSGEKKKLDEDCNWYWQVTFCVEFSQCTWFHLIFTMYMIAFKF